MPKPSSTPQILARLEVWLEEREAAYQAQPESTRKPTLPHTPDFKINVSAVAEGIQLNPKTQRKYLHEKEELRSLVNMFAEGQGLLPIGSRTLEIADKAIQQKMAIQASKAKEDPQAATEANARVAAMMDELAEAHRRIAELESELMRFKTREELLHSGLLVRIEE